MQSNEGFALNVIKKALNSQIKDQVDVPDPNYSLLNVWNVDIPIALLWKTVIVVELVAVADTIVVDT
jgi:hypothetical protein